MTKFIGTLGNKNVQTIMEKAGNMPGLAKHLSHKIGGDPHFFTKCMGDDSISGYDDDVKKRICAKAHKLVVGKWPAEGMRSKKHMKVKLAMKKVRQV